MGIFITIQPFADEQDGQPRRNVETLLGTGDTDVDPEPVHVQIFGKEGADDIHHQRQIVPAADSGDPLQIEQLPRRGLVMLAEEHVRAFRLYDPLKLVVVDVFGERNLEVDDRDAVVPAERDPALPEGSAVDGDRLFLRADVVLHDGAHRPGSGTGVDDDLSSLAMNQIQEDTLVLEIYLGDPVGSHVWDRL